MGVFTATSESLCRSLSGLLHPGEELACVEMGFGFEVTGHHVDTGVVTIAWFGRSLLRLDGVPIELIEDGLFGWRLARNSPDRGGDS